MGSFTEVVLSFPLAKEVPDEILAAFSDWHTPLIGRLEGSESPLPTFDTLDIGDADAAELVDEIDMADAALFEEAPLGQKAFVWHAMFEGMDTVYFSGHPNTHLVWEPFGKYWTLTTRFQRKSGADTVCGLLAPLGAFAAEPGNEEHPLFIGYVKFEYDDHPLLVWRTMEPRFVFEDLRVNPNE